MGQLDTDDVREMKRIVVEIITPAVVAMQTDIKAFYEHTKAQAYTFGAQQASDDFEKSLDDTESAVVEMEQIVELLNDFANKIEGFIVAAAKTSGKSAEDAATQAAQAKAASMQ